MGPVIVITNNGWGTPADAVWVYMSRMRNVTLYYSDHAEVLTPGSQPGTYSLRRDKWLFPPYQDVRFPPQVPVLYVTGNLIENGPAEEFLRQHNANLGTPLTFKGVSNPKTGLDDPEEGRGVGVLSYRRRKSTSRCPSAALESKHTGGVH